MKSSKEWYSAKELEGLDGLPSHATNITRKAKNQGWISRDAKGVKGGGLEYHISSLPPETLAALGINHINSTTNKQAIFENTAEYTTDDGFEFIEDCRNVLISAGYGAENTGYIPRRMTKIERSWLIQRGLKAENCALFLISGESMKPTLNDGEEVVVDRSKTILKEGKIFIFNHSGYILAKKVQVTYDGIALISDNPTYTPIVLSRDEANKLLVIGQVVRSYRDF
ncbi:helix-turn-helix domain-containing protein [Pasteurella multocida]|uniref:helix-turn-helix domain-containing protein n=1 Tax=Pasteurella multocida TaxID=747 RepID=UPI00061A8309|nr:S24 family peptidase [Pasteurella multocida]AKD37528.1 phage repressor [Pasteurella multocida subsp. multocida OH4807]MDX3896873.1 S24 family peptidase [Pasteurella multocida]